MEKFSFSGFVSNISLNVFFCWLTAFRIARSGYSSGVSHQNSPSGQTGTAFISVVVVVDSTSSCLVVVSTFVVVDVSIDIVVVSLGEKLIASAVKPPLFCNSSNSKGNKILPLTRDGITRSRKFMLFIDSRFVIVV